MRPYIKAYFDAFRELLGVFGSAFLIFYVLIGRSFFADYALMLIFAVSFAGPIKLALQKKDTP